MILNRPNRIKTKKLDLNFLFHSNKTVAHVCHEQFDVGNYMITRTKNTKYLGFIIDDELTWKDHVNDLCKRLIKYTRAFSTE